MSSFVIDNVKVIGRELVLEDSALKVEDGRIDAVGRAGTLRADRVIDGKGMYLCPGFIDLHVHGGGGHDFMDATPEAVRGALTAHMNHGTTTIVPTTLCAEDDELSAVFDSIAEVKNSPDARRLPRIPGVHLEGPFISPEQAGAQDPKYIKNPTPEAWRDIVRRAKGQLLIWTVAPELPGALDMCRELKDEGVIFSAGHSSATYDQAEAGYSAGFTMATHVYSSMSTIIRVKGERVPGLLEATLLRSDKYVEVIADGRHLPIPLLYTIKKNVPLELIVLVTDAMRGAGMPDGEYLLGSLKNGQRVLVFDGIAHMPDGVSFAGSVATANRLVRVMHREAGVPLHDAVRMMTENPALAIGLVDRGAIKRGYLADLCLMDENFEVKKVFIGGEQTVG